MQVASDQRGGIHPREDGGLACGALRQPVDSEARVGHCHPAVEWQSRLFTFEVSEELGFKPIEWIVRAARADSDSVYKDQ